MKSKGKENKTFWSRGGGHGRDHTHTLLVYHDWEEREGKRKTKEKVGHRRDVRRDDHCGLHAT